LPYQSIDLLTATAAEAQITQFNGPLTIELKWEERQQLEPWPKPTVFDVYIGSRNLLAKNCDERGFGFARLAMTEVPPKIQPVATFEFPAATPGAKPAIQKHALDQRCCGDTFYTQFTMPKDAERGNIKVTVECAGWSDRQVSPATFNIPINEGLSRFGEFSYVMFHSTEIKIEDAVDAFRKRGWNVSVEPQGLTVLDNNRPTFGVKLVRSKLVQETSAALGKGSEDATQISACDARFEISFADIEKTMQEPNTLHEIQSALQDLTRGYLYNTWDKQFSAPRPGSSAIQK
jgi:hypothetical protein